MHDNTQAETQYLPTNQNPSTDSTTERSTGVKRSSGIAIDSPDANVAARTATKKKSGSKPKKTAKKPAAKKKTAAKKAVSKKPVKKKTAVKKSTSKKKPAAKKTAAKKTASKKPAVKKTAASKKKAATSKKKATASKKAPARKTATKTAAKKKPASKPKPTAKKKPASKSTKKFTAMASRTSRRKPRVYSSRSSLESFFIGDQVIFRAVRDWNDQHKLVRMRGIVVTKGMDSTSGMNFIEVEFEVESMTGEMVKQTRRFFVK